MDNVQISCATNAELAEMYNRPTYTDHYKSLILAELRRRGVIDLVGED